MAAHWKTKLLFAAVIVLFVVAAINTSTLLAQRQTAIEQVSRYNVAWLVSQATTEFARLEQRVAAFGSPGSGVGRDEVELRFDITINRLKLLESGDVLEFLASDPEHQATVAELRRVIAVVQPLVENIEAPGNPQKLLKLLAPMGARLGRLAAAANRFGGDQVADDQRQLLHLHWQFAGLVAGLIACGIVLIALLLWHNRLLTLAHRELHVLVEGMSQQNERFDAALNNMSQGLCMADADQRVIVCNKQYLDLFALPDGHVKEGTPIRDLLGERTSSGRKGELLSAVLASQQPLIKSGRIGSYFQDIADRTIAISHRPMAGGGWVATYADISERRRAEARIFHMAHHDALTDLPNRLLLRERMEDGFLRCRSHGACFSILFLDLDGFKNVNDTLGHPAGDELLRIVARRLRSCAREIDLVARLGGDEFAIMHAAPDTSRDFDRFVRRVLEAIEAPYDLNGQQVVIGTSIGVAVAPRDGSDADELFKNADLALYRAKADGRGTYRFFEQKMDIALQDRRALEMDLRKALAAGEFDLCYQPIVNLASKEITGCEALLRWQHPQRGAVSPAEFIPLAEEIGLIVPIGEWVLRQACLQAASWPGKLRVAVNLSPLQLKSRHLVQTILVALSTSGLSTDRLELEITETVLLQDNETTLSTLHDLRHHGVRIALDDFGTGYSSLSYLRSFPFDKIKLDQSFVRDVVNRPDCMAIVQSIADLGRNLGMTTTAEGIETEEQLSILRDAGFLEGQGYYFSAPKSSRDLCLPFAQSEAA